MSYQSVCVAKITSALEYRLKRLHEDGHVIATFRKPYKAQWKPYTRAWGDDDWDGNTSVVVASGLDSISSPENSVEDRYGQDLIQQMSQLSINTEYNTETASAEAQDQQRLYQEEQREANKREIERKREERFQLEQQRQKQEQLRQEQRKRDYQREQERLAKQREGNRKQQQQQIPSPKPQKELLVSKWAIGVNPEELMPEDSLSSKQWKPTRS